MASGRWDGNDAGAGGKSAQPRHSLAYLLMNGAAEPLWRRRMDSSDSKASAGGRKGTMAMKPDAGLEKAFNPYEAEEQLFMSSSIKDMYQEPTREESTGQQDAESVEMEIKNLLKDVQRFGSSHMSWKERKKIENQNVVSLGGKPLKKQKVPLNIAKATMKNRRHKEQKMLQDELILDRFRNRGSNRSKKLDKRKPEDIVLKATEGHFKKGILNVKHLLQPASSSRENNDAHRSRKGKKGKKGGQKKKGNRKRH